MQNITQRIKHYWAINWLRRSVIGLVTVLIILILIPVIAQYSIVHLLEKQGAREARIEDININLFAGTVELTNLNIQTHSDSSTQLDKLSLDMNMLELFSNRIVVNDLNLAGLKAHILRQENGDILIDGLNLTASDNNPENESDSTQPAESSAPPAFGINQLSLKNIDVTYAEKDFTQHATLQELLISKIRSWEPASTANLKLSGSLNKAPMDVEVDLNLFDAKKRFKGQASVQSLALMPYEKFYRDYISTLKGKVSVNADFDVSLAEKVEANVTQKIVVKELNADYQNINQELASLVWEGKTVLAESGALKVEGGLKLEQSKTTDTQQNYLMASINEFAVENVSYDPETILFKKLTIDDLRLIQLEDESKFVELQNLSVENFDFKPSQSTLNINQVKLSQPLIEVKIDKDKQLVHVQQLMATLDALKPADTQEKVSQHTTETQKPLSLSVAKVSLDSPGMLMFSDNSVSPKYKSKILFNEIDIQNLSSEQPADFKVKLQQGEYTLFDFKGQGLLLDPTRQLEMKATIKQLDLPPVTPYTSQAMGYGMKSGVVDTQIDLKLKERTIDSMVDLKIDSIEVVETNKETAEQVSSASGMSIDLAVSTLKDSDNVIELKLPVKGNIDEPDFDLSLIINKAMGEAMKSASLSYLKHTLQPFGSLITLFKLAKAAADHISLPPVMFKSNSLEFAEQQQELLDKVVKVLKERPGLKIKACAVSALEDQAAIKAQLIEAEKQRLAKIQKEQKDKKKTEIKDSDIIIDEQVIQQKMQDLADQRAAKVKAFFLKKGELESSRILNCLSTTNIDTDSKPSVELQI